MREFFVNRLFYSILRHKPLRMKKRNLIYLLALCCLPLTTIYAQIPTDKVLAGLQAIADEYKAVGVAVVVVKDNKPVYSQAIGYKNVDTKEALSTQDLFRIASISKSFSATAVMQLVEQGRLNLNDDVSSLVGFLVRNPKFPTTPITLRMLLSHTSSINDSNGYFDFDVINPATNAEWAKSYNAIQPGEGYMYCNLNFNMIGAILERVSGMRFDTYIKKMVLNPLGLQAGYCVDSLDSKRFATLYEYESGLFKAQPAAYNPRREDIEKYILGRSTPIFSPTGGLKISAEDLASYMRMHMNYGSAEGKQLISTASAQLMQQPLTTEEGYGLALTVTDKMVPGVSLVGHTGSAYGLYSTMFFNPTEKYGFVVVTNGCVASYENGFVRLSAKIVNYLYTNFIE